MIRKGLIRSRQHPGMFFQFTRPGRECRGCQFDDLENAVRETASGKVLDRLQPPGAWVGYVTYEGEFHFTHFPEPELVEGSAILPQPFHKPVGEVTETNWATDTSREAYAHKVALAQDHIRAGDIYQVNLCRSYERAVGEIDTMELFRGLWQITDAPMAAYLESDQITLLSASPELFLILDGRQIRTSPIKGTRPRDPDPLRDRQNAFELSTHEKEIAELVMITDLERNDLGAICEYGSVQVPRLVECETFSHVHHLVSDVEGTLKEGVSPVRALQACLPGGSITGAPKTRAMEIIRDLESGPRGPYTGVIGYFGDDGSAQFSIAIRTAVFRDGRLSFGVGSGITAGSDPCHEFEETRQKARCLLQAYEAYRSQEAPVHQG
jgi:para-aminobenzoate synthetase component 1